GVRQRPRDQETRSRYRLDKSLLIATAYVAGSTGLRPMLHRHSARNFSSKTRTSLGHDVGEVLLDGRGLGSGLPCAWLQDALPTIRTVDGARTQGASVRDRRTD